MVLEFFVAKINTKLLETVRLETFKTRNIQDAYYVLLCLVTLRSQKKQAADFNIAPKVVTQLRNSATAALVRHSAVLDSLVLAAVAANSH